MPIPQDKELRFDMYEGEYTHEGIGVPLNHGDRLGITDRALTP